MIQFIKKNLLTAILTFLMIIIPVYIINADGSGVIGDGKIKNPLSSSIDTIPKFLTALLEGAIKIAIPIVALAVIYSGFLFVKAQGNPEEITKAKDAMLYTLIGAAVLLGALAIAKLVADTITAVGS